MITTTKLVTIFLGLSLTAFMVATIVLAVQRDSLRTELKGTRDKLDKLEESLKQSSTVEPTTTVDPTVSTTSAHPEIPLDYRLPKDLIPSSYDLYLNPNIETGNFNGKVVIRINVNTATDRIVLHAKDLVVTEIYLTNKGSETISILGYEFDTVRDFLTIQLSEKLTENRYFNLGILFNGSMEGKIVGLYKSSYTKDDGSKKAIATSKFEPTFARQAFPCFDEPQLKATFQVTLVHPKNGDYHALSNMDVIETKDQGLYNEVFFNKSVPMSTYLACFILSDFKYKEIAINTNGIGETFHLRVYATPEQLGKTIFALGVGKTVIEYYIDYFQIEYPLPKLDMAAIPDFVSGAMEHWGLVTYRETSLLYTEGTSSTVNKQRVATVIAHEFAHMWFGNLVTMKWWNDLWLNEGFASYIEHKGTNAAFPEWKMLDQFIVGTLHGVLSLDATLGSHPIIQTVETPDQITEIFDTITYSKGSSIIRMLEDFLGPDNFRLAVTNYLNKFKYNNAVTDDFLTEIDNLQLGFDVKAIMRTWTEQMGLPVVNVEKLSDTKYKLTQKRFFANPNDYDNIYNDSPFNYTWSIPITYTTSASSDVQRAWFYYNQKEATIEIPIAVDWIKFNFDQIGYYRVNYEKSLWDTLANKLIANSQIFSAGDRACLLNDAFSLADATQLDYDLALDMTKYLSNEVDFMPWSVAASKLVSLKRKLMFTNVYSEYRDYGQSLIRDSYDNVGWVVGEDHLKNRLRITILSAACSLGVENCLSEAANRFNTFLEKPDDRPHADIREIVYYYGMMAAGNEQTWSKMWDIFIAETDASEKSKLMYGLSGVQAPWILNRFIQLAWDENNVRGQDYFSCLQNIASNPIGEPIVWEYVRENWPKLVERFGLNERYLGSMIPSVTGQFSTQTRFEEMQYFFNKYPEAGAGASARVRALENVKNNIVWLENNYDKIVSWLIKQAFSSKIK